MSEQTSNINPRMESLEKSDIYYDCYGFNADLVGGEPRPSLDTLTIIEAFEQLRIDRIRLHDAQNALSIKQDAYDDTKRDMILGGHVVGKNEAEREAKLADLMRVQIAQLRDAQRAERTARLHFDIAQDSVKRLQMLATLD